MDQLHELHASGRFDLIIVDTPPSRNALDVLDAPGRMKEFFGSRLLKWLTLPYRSRLFTAASKPFYQVADRVLGSRFLQDVAEPARFHAVGTTLAQRDASSIAPLLDALVEEESVRVRTKIADGFVASEWAVPDDRREAVRKVLPYQYSIDGEGFVRKRG